MKCWVFLLDEPMFSMQRRIVLMERWMFSMERRGAGTDDAPAHRQPGGFVRDAPSGFGQPSWGGLKPAILHTGYRSPTQATLQQVAGEEVGAARHPYPAVVRHAHRERGRTHHHRRRRPHARVGDVRSTQATRWWALPEAFLYPAALCS